MDSPLPLPVERAIQKLGSDISLARRRRHISQASLAERMGASLTTVRRMEEKWGLTPGNRGSLNKFAWTREHRRYRLAKFYKRLQSLGRKPSRWLKERIIDPLETYFNRRRFPLERFCRCGLCSPGA